MMVYRWKKRRIFVFHWHTFLHGSSGFLKRREVIKRLLAKLFKTIKISNYLLHHSHKNSDGEGDYKCYESGVHKYNVR